MEREVRVLVGVCYLVVGLSHVLQPKVWAAFFEGLVARGRTGSFINGLLTLPLGALIVAFHPVWSGWAVIVTIIGWLYVAKSALCFCFPDVGLRSMSRASVERSSGFVWAGGAMLALGALLVALR